MKLDWVPSLPTEITFRNVSAAALCCARVWRWVTLTGTKGLGPQRAWQTVCAQSTGAGNMVWTSLAPLTSRPGAAPTARATSYPLELWYTHRQPTQFLGCVTIQIMTSCISFSVSTSLSGWTRSRYVCGVLSAFTVGGDLGSRLVPHVRAPRAMWVACHPGPVGRALVAVPYCWLLLRRAFCDYEGDPRKPRIYLQKRVY